jgi:hypothetical protein
MQRHLSVLRAGQRVARYGVSLLGCPIELDCKTLPSIVGNFIMGNAECKTAADCAFVTTACGLQGVCGAYVNAAVAKASRRNALAGNVRE